jgi:hypothetical protein
MSKERSTMSKKNKRVAVFLCALLGLAVVVTIGSKLIGGGNETEIIKNNGGETDNAGVSVEAPGVYVPADVNVTESDDPGAAADSEGEEQTIQGDAKKPSTSPALPEQSQEGHTAEDVAEKDRNAEAPPPSTPTPTPTTPAPTGPAAGSTNGDGQVYVPGFGYVDGGGDSTGIEAPDMTENGNKVGEMG